MKKLPYLLSIITVLNLSVSYAQSPAKDGWITLFDGKTLNGWRQATKDSLPDAAWGVSNNELSFDPKKFHGTDIITTKSFKDFDFTLQYKISEGGNSGIKFFLIPNTNLGCEFQII